VKLEAIIGANIARLRTRWRIGQPEFGRRVGEFLGEKPWSRQTISALENGNRSFTARDLVVIAYLLEVPVSALLYIGPEVREVQVGGRTFSYEELTASGWQTEQTTEDLAEVSAALGNLFVRLRGFLDDATEIETEVSGLNAAVTRVRHRQSLEALGVNEDRDYE